VRPANGLWLLICLATTASMSGCGGSSPVTTNAPASPTSVAAGATAPTITTQPGNQAVTAGQTATFTVVASGTAPLQYQWRNGGTAIAGAVGASYTTPATATTDGGSSFTVVVSNTVGSVTSAAAVLSVTTAAASTAAAGTDVVTYKFDGMRTGQNLTETTLTPSTVTAPTFGKLRNLMVDGLVDAQPLYLSQLSVSGAAHNVVYIATEHDSVYAYDSDTGAILWHASVLGTGETTSDDRNCSQLTPEIGITATPVIDRGAGMHGLIYVVAMSKDAAAHYHHRLHALDVTTGQEQSGSPTEITATYGTTAFDPGAYVERAALLLGNGAIYTSFASHCDIGPYGGWVVGFDEATLAIKSVLNLAPNASGTGFASQGPSIWMSGGGPALDTDGNFYVLTANGRFDTTLNVQGFPTGGDYGNSFVKIAPSGATLAVADFFTLSGEIAESTNDVDLGSGGVMLLPDLTDSQGTVRHLAVGAGKDGNLYVVNRDAMGGFSSVGNNIWQELDGVLGGGIWSTPAYFNSAVYFGPVAGPLVMFPVTNARLPTAPTSQSALRFPYPGTFPVVSANGTSDAIVWAYENSSPAVLHAYAAANLSTELYNSNQAAGQRDQFGSGNKFIVPVVADGKVFVATTNSVAVFGRLP